MTTKLEKLTSEQESQLSVYRDLGIEIGLSTEPADRERAEAGAKKAYELAGLDPPKNFIWCGSPLEGAKKTCEFSALAKNPVWALVNNEKAKNQARNQIWGQAWGQAWSQVWNQIWGQVWYRWYRVRKQVRDQIVDQVGEWVFPIYGQHESHWLVFYKYFQEVCGIKNLEIIDGLWEVSNSAGWWWPFEDTVILTERPCELHLDAQGRLHNEKGMAVRYPDGWGFYALNGKIVDKKDLPQKPLKRFYYLGYL